MGKVKNLIWDEIEFEPENMTPEHYRLKCGHSARRMAAELEISRQNQVIYSVMQEINFYRNELANHAEKVQEKMCGADPLDALIGSSRTLETAAKYWAVRRVLICFAKYTEGNTEAIEAIENELFWLTKDALRGNYSPAIRNYENQLKALALQESVQTLKDAMKREGVE